MVRCQKLFPSAELLQWMLEKLEQVLLTLGFYTTWKSHVKHFLQLYPWVLFFVLLQSLRELFLCSSCKASFHDNSWGLSINFFTHTQAFFIPKLHEDLVPALSSVCSRITSSAQLNIWSQAFTHYVRREWCLKFLVKQQIGTKKNQTSWKMTEMWCRKHGQYNMQ